jgi:RHS repeat-associated protein
MTKADGGNEASNTFNAFGVSFGAGWTYERTRRRFAGEEDDDNGVMYLRARYYEPYIGRFLSRDPFPMDETNTQGINRYVYVQNNPVNFVDPTGEIADTLLDVGFIGYDLYDIGRTIRQGHRPTWRQWASLGADVALAAVPFATGGGAALRLTEKSAKSSRALVPYLDITRHARDAMAERGVSLSMATKVVARGQRYWDPRNQSVVYVLRRAMASGKDIAVATVPFTHRVKTVMVNRGVVLKRYIKIR